MPNEHAPISAPTTSAAARPLVRFYFNAPSRERTLCQLVHQLFRQGRTIGLYVESAAVRQWDQLLWTYSPTAFLPHCLADSEGAAETPVWIAPDATTLASRQILVNLTPHPLPEGLLTSPSAVNASISWVEIVPHDDAAARAAARQHVKHYRAVGHEVRFFDLAQQAASTTSRSGG